MKNPMRSPIETELLRQQNRIIDSIRNGDITEAENWTGITGNMRQILDDLDSEPVRKLGLAVIEASQEYKAEHANGWHYDTRALAAVVMELCERYRKGKL